MQNVTYDNPSASHDLRLVTSVIENMHDNEPLMTEAYGENGV